MVEPWIRDSRPLAQITSEFWAEQRRLRLHREEVEAMPRGVERFEAILREVWTKDNLIGVMYDEPIRWGPQDLDEWLAEDNPRRLTHFGVPGIGETLGL